LIIRYLVNFVDRLVILLTQFLLAPHNGQLNNLKRTEIILDDCKIKRSARILYRFSTRLLNKNVVQVCVGLYRQRP